MSESKTGNWFEEVADIDVDSAVVRVGLHHHVLGPPSPGFMVSTGAVDVGISFHESDVDAVIDAFKRIKRRLAVRVLAPPHD